MSEPTPETPVTEPVLTVAELDRAIYRAFLEYLAASSARPRVATRIAAARDELADLRELRASIV